MKILEIIQQTATLNPPKDFPDFEKKLDQYLRYVRAAKPFEKELDKIEAFSHVFDIPTYLGIEEEVENIHKQLSLPPFWKNKTDGSLRNGGMEFISEPLPPKQAMIATVVLRMMMRKLTASSPDYSWRTSDHVHLNVQELEEEEFRRLMMLAFIFEKLFFTLAGTDREQSIFCVPITQSVTREKLGIYLRKKTNLHQLATEWPKYSAVNLCRMFQYGHPSDGIPALGTVEFRHLGGTEDVTKLLVWQSLILQLFKAAIAIPTKTLVERVETLNTNNKYMDFVHEVFTPEVADNFKIKDCSELFSDTIRQTKELLLTRPKFGPIREKSAMSSFALKSWEAAHKAAASKTTKKVVRKTTPVTFSFDELA